MKDTPSGGGNQIKTSILISQDVHRNLDGQLSAVLAMMDVIVAKIKLTK